MNLLTANNILKRETCKIDMSSKQRAVSKDKWKAKKWFKVIAPALFGSANLGLVPASDENSIIGRKIETTLYDLTGDFNAIYSHLYFQIIKVEGDNAYTRFKGYELSRDFIKSLIRRKSTKIEHVLIVNTKDNYKLKVKTLALTTYKIQRSQQASMRHIIEDIITKRAQESTFDEFVKSMIFESLSNDLFQSLKKIAPLRKVEIAKSRVLVAGIEDKKVEEVKT